MSGRDSDAPDGRERRQHARMAVHWQGSLIAGDQEEECYILDISPAGARVQTPDPLDGHRDLVLRLAQGDTHDGQVVWRQGSFLGLHFPSASLAVATG